MNIRTAILQAADSIEQQPSRFNFCSTRNPNKGCNTPGCAVGWIGCHMNLAAEGADMFREVAKALGVGSWMGTDFYIRMDALSPMTGRAPLWRRNASDCAMALRKYADKYHPAESAVAKHTGIPTSVLEIFQGSEVAISK